MKTLIAGIALALIAVPGNAWDPVVDLQKQCDSGRAGGCTILAEWYAEGASGLKKDPAKAEDLYKRGAALAKAACDKGSGDDCNTLAGLYEDGHGVPKDEARAEALSKQAVAGYQQACDKGNMHECVSLAAAYRNGGGVAKDVARAAALFQKVCDQVPPNSPEKPTACSAAKEAKDMKKP
jgi:uncharacterized protein